MLSNFLREGKKGRSLQRTAHRVAKVKEGEEEGGQSRQIKWKKKNPIAQQRNVLWRALVKKKERRLGKGFLCGLKPGTRRWWAREGEDPLYCAEGKKRHNALGHGMIWIPNNTKNNDPKDCPRFIGLKKRQEKGLKRIKRYTKHGKGVPVIRKKGNPQGKTAFLSARNRKRGKRGRAEKLRL